MRNKLNDFIKLVRDDSIPTPSRLRSKTLLLLQMIYGILWLDAAWWKIRVNGDFGLNYDGLSYWISRGLEYPVLGVYARLIDNVLLPNIKLVLPVVFVIELSIGLLFISTRYVRVAALLAMAQTIAIILSVIFTPHEWNWTYYMMMMLNILFFVNPSTHTWLSNSQKK